MEGVDPDGFFYADLEAEREMERESQTAPNDEGGGVGAVQQQLALTAAPFAFLKSVNDGSCRHVVVPHASYMPPLRGTKVPYTPCGTTATAEIDIEPVPNTQHAYGSITLASPWMGGGKTSAKRDFQKVLIRESPDMRTLDIDCNRIYSVSNAVNLKKTAAELHAEGGARPDDFCLFRVDGDAAAAAYLARHAGKRCEHQMLVLDPASVSARLLGPPPGRALPERAEAEVEAEAHPGDSAAPKPRFLGEFNALICGSGAGAEAHLFARTLIETLGVKLGNKLHLGAGEPA